MPDDRRPRERPQTSGDERGGSADFRGVLRDVTAQRRLEEQLRRSQKMEAVGRLVEGVAHDFNNLLTAINGYSELALLQISEDHPLHAGIAEIRRAGKRAAELTRRLLVLSRSRAASPRRLDLNRVVANMEKLLRRVLGEDIEIETRLDPEVSAIHADQGQIEQILLNLAINARDAMATGGRLTLETENCRPAPAAGPALGGQVRLTVRDCGAGMEEEARERGNDADVGLAIVYSNVRQCGGRVEVESEAGAGSTFRLFFPALETAEASAAAAEPPADLPRGRETVLLVEDESSVRSLVQRILELQGYTVLAARDADAAKALCRGLDAGPDLLLTDVVMPQTTGPSLAEDLKRRFGELKVLFISGYTDSRAGVGLLNQKRASFLPKPFSPEILARKVREVLDGPAGAGGTPRA